MVRDVIMEPIITGLPQVSGRQHPQEPDQPGIQIIGRHGITAIQILPGIRIIDRRRITAMIIIIGRTIKTVIPAGITGIDMVTPILRHGPVVIVVDSVMVARTMGGFRRHQDPGQDRFRLHVGVRVRDSRLWAVFSG